MKRFLLIALNLYCLSAFAQGTGTVQFSESSAFVDEGVGDISIEVVREKSNLLAGSVEYEIIKSSATIVDDYEMVTSGLLSWAADDQASKFITITIIDDPDEEPDEVIVLRLLNPSEGTYIGDSAKTTITISGEEVGQLGFAVEKYITSEYDGFAKILVSRRNGLRGALLVDYEVRELSVLGDDHLGQVTHYRSLPEELNESGGISSTRLPGVEAQAGSDFMPEQGTLLFLDHQSSASFTVRVLPNFDGRAYPHTVLEMALDNARPLTSLDQLAGLDPYFEDFATVSYLADIGGNPNSFTPENEILKPTIDTDRKHASLRINDISGPAPDLIWEGEPVPDDPNVAVGRRVGFRFEQARYTTYESGSDGTFLFPVRVFRSAPFNESVTVRYMVGPNRGFMVDDPRENWENEEAKANPLTESLENWARIQNPGEADKNQDPYTDTGDQMFGATEGDDTSEDGNRYANQPGDEPRIKPDALYGNLYFGDFEQLMHNAELDIALLNPGSDMTSPTGSREYSPSFNKPLVKDDVKRDFKVKTGTLSWDAGDLEPKVIEIEIINDGYLEFNEDLIVVLYDPDVDKD